MTLETCIEFRHLWGMPAILKYVRREASTLRTNFGLLCVSAKNSMNAHMRDVVGLSYLWLAW